MKKRAADLLVESLGRVHVFCQYNGADEFELWLMQGGVEIARGRFSGELFDHLINDRRPIVAEPISLGRDGRSVVISVRDHGEFATVSSECFRDVVVRAIGCGVAHGMKGWAQAARPVTLGMTREEEIEVRALLKERRGSKRKPDAQ
jgi:hypothetical protein